MPFVQSPNKIERISVIYGTGQRVLLYFTENIDTYKFTQNNQFYSTRLKGFTGDEKFGNNVMLQSQTYQSVGFDDDEKFDVSSIGN